MITVGGRVPIHIHPLFWLSALLVGWLYTHTVVGTAVCVCVVLCSLLIHEFGHALTALFFQQEASVYLVAFGGLTVRRGKKLKLWQEFCVILNGPLMGMAAFLLASLLQLWLKQLPALSVKALELFLFINFYWSLLNLIPLVPLDGGRLMLILFESVLGLRGMRAGLITSFLLSLGLAVFFFTQGVHLPALLVLLFSFESLRDWLASRKIRGEDRDEQTISLYEQAQLCLHKGNMKEAVEKLQEVRLRAKAGVYHLRSSVDLASILSRSGEVEQAYLLLAPLRHQLEQEAVELFHELAFQMGEWKEATVAGMKSYRQAPQFRKAFQLALCHARLGELPAVMGWLERARRDGMPQLHVALDRAEFDPFRLDASFKTFRSSVTPP